MPRLQLVVGENLICAPSRIRQCPLAANLILTIHISAEHSIVAAGLLDPIKRKAAGWTSKGAFHSRGECPFNLPSCQQPSTVLLMAKENGCEMCRVADPKTVKALVARRKKLGVRVEDIAPLMGLGAPQLWRMESLTRRMNGRRVKEYEAAVVRLAKMNDGKEDRKMSDLVRRMETA